MEALTLHVIVMHIFGQQLLLEHGLVQFFGKRVYPRHPLPHTIKKAQIKHRKFCIVIQNML